MSAYCSEVLCSIFFVNLLSISILFSSGTEYLRAKAFKGLTINANKTQEILHLQIISFFFFSLLSQYKSCLFSSSGFFITKSFIFNLNSVKFPKFLNFVYAQINVCSPYTQKLYFFFFFFFTPSLNMTLLLQLKYGYHLNINAIKPNNLTCY